MIHTLRRQLTAPETLSRLQALAASAPDSAPVSLHLPLGRCDTDWLDLLPAHQPHWYRARPDRCEYRLAIGHALHVATAGTHRFAALDNAYAGFCRHWRHNGPALAFAGFAFDAASNAPLPNALLSIPAILLHCIDGDCSVTLSAPAGRLAQATAEWLPMLASPPATGAPQLLPGRPEPLNDRAWIARVNAALRDIAAGRVAKVVLSRSRKLQASGPFAPATILGRLIAQQPGGVIYAHGNGQQTFLGASPERLVRLRGAHIDVDALAGTAWPGSLALSESKNRHEQSLVVRAICDAIAPLCEAPPHVGAIEEHPAGLLAHWRSRISAEARPGTRLFDVVRALHPTPAVGGYPAAAALDWLAAHGEQRSGWYSGGFGVLTPAGDGEFSVALRSALIDGNSAELQAGAGIVAGSDPRHELAETEAKLGTLLAALAPGPLPDSDTSRSA
ncbi:MAG: chorismate-binding protein [Azonexus sp.]|jgi:salicylate biosynthesis isochorismate synthase|nr:chorismate-binding protein [Azonexus sp.]